MRIGVVVPVRGFAPYLAEALDCVLAERPDEVVVVDDGSFAPLVLHPDHAPRCTLVRRDEAGGPAAARATGLAALGADVDVVALSDGDDAWEPGKLAAQREALADHPDAALCFGRATIVGSDGRATGEGWSEPGPGPLPDAARALYPANPLPTSSVVLRRAALEQVGGFASPVALAEDWDLWLRLAATGAPLVCEPRARIRYRRHPGGLTTDVASLAACQLALHERHGALVDRAAREAALRCDRAALRRERLRRTLRSRSVR